MLNIGLTKIPAITWPVAKTGFNKVYSYNMITNVKMFLYQGKSRPPLLEGRLSMTSKVVDALNLKRAC